MTIADAHLFAQAEQYQTELLQTLFGVQSFAAASAGGGAPTSAIPAESNVVGLGFGAKEAGGSAADELALRVYVRAKLPASALDDEERIPATVNGVPTDVIPVGDLAAFWPRPVSCGVSVGHRAVTGGTLGCLVTLGNAPNTYILSNNHVLANSNAAAVGDDILEPGPLDGGAAHPRLARLHAWETLHFGGPPNSMDAAIAQLANPADVNHALLTIGAIVPPPTAASLYQSVRKRGRTTAHTVGVVMDLAASIRVRYGTQIAHFRNQLGIQGVGAAPFSNPGDSGSLIVDAVSRRPVGLLFAGGSGVTFANYIDPVLTRFGATIL